MIKNKENGGLHSVASRINLYLPITLYILVVSYFWQESILYGKTIIHADAAHHGMTLLTFLSNWLRGGESLLWFPGIYGGHPLFAESQGGFLNPINIICALLFDPVYGAGIMHWLNMLLSGVGVYCICRTLSISRWAASFAAVAVTYSSSWLGFQYNISVSGTLLWTVWFLAAFQYWFQAPDVKKSILMAITASLVLFSGYPHLAHGAAIYICAYFLSFAFHIEGRSFISNNRTAIFAGGLTSLFVTILLSAVQLIPMIELIGNSHRSEGIKMILAGVIPPAAYIRGLFIFGWTNKISCLEVYGSLASLVVLSLALLSFLVKTPARVFSHAFAAFILFNLGMDFGSPLFKVVYEYHLIPGLHNYRAMHPFFPLAVIGFSILAAYVLSYISRQDFCFRSLVRSNNKKVVISVAFFVIALLVSFLYIIKLNFHYYLLPASTLMVVILLVGGKYSRYISLIVTLMLVTEVLVFRSAVFNFYSPDVLAPPSAIKAIQSDQDYQQYKAKIANVYPAYVFMASNDPGLDKGYRNFLNSLSPLPGVLFGIPSVDGALALASERRKLLEPVIERELKENGEPNGDRMIDILGIRYISLDRDPGAKDVKLFYVDPEGGVRIYKNTRAQPFYSTYTRADFVKTPAEALQQIKANSVGHLYVESSEFAADGAPCQSEGPKAPEVTLMKRSYTKYIFRVKSECSGWLYLNDAYFPGWKATINGNAAPVYPAQVLGKAVYFSGGENDVVISYRPISFYSGAMISALGVIVAFLLYWKGRAQAVGAAVSLGPGA